MKGMSQAGARPRNLPPRPPLTRPLGRPPPRLSRGRRDRPGPRRLPRTSAAGPGANELGRERRSEAHPHTSLHGVSGEGSGGFLTPLECPLLPDRKLRTRRRQGARWVLGIYARVLSEVRKRFINRGSLELKGLQSGWVALEGVWAAFTSMSREMTMTKQSRGEKHGIGNGQRHCDNHARRRARPHPGGATL